MNTKRIWTLYVFVFFIMIGINFFMADINAGAGTSISLITPYVNESDMESINEAFSVDECAPWGFGNHLGIDFSPTGTIGDSQGYKCFRFVCPGTVTLIDRYYNPSGGPNGNGQWQVNVMIEYDSTYSVLYAFETWSEVEDVGIQQESMILSHIQLNQSYVQGQNIGELIKAGDGAHIHFGLRENGMDVCPEPYFTLPAKNSILNILQSTWPHGRMCYGLEETIPTANIVVDGNITDWSGVNAQAGDWQGDDQGGYNGADIEAIYLARDANNLFIRMDLYGVANTDFGNGPHPDEGRYGFYLENNGPFPILYLGVAYDKFNSQWSLGYNGSNGPNTPGILIGPGFVGVNGGFIEIRAPLSIIGSPLDFTRIHGEVVNCCVPNWGTLDKIHCVSQLHLSGGPGMLSPSEAIKLLITYIESLKFPEGMSNSLNSKLESAIKSLEKNQLKAAKNILHAFINQVEAQTAKKIPLELTKGLIEAAQSIIDSI